jgi:hypothetical protein
MLRWRPACSSTQFRMGMSEGPIHDQLLYKPPSRLVAGELIPMVLKVLHHGIPVGSQTRTPNSQCNINGIESARFQCL